MRNRGNLHIETEALTERKALHGRSLFRRRGGARGSGEAHGRDQRLAHSTRRNSPEPKDQLYMLLSAQGRGIGTALLESCQEPLSPLQPVGHPGATPTRAGFMSATVAPPIKRRSRMPFTSCRPTGEADDARRRASKSIAQSVTGARRRPVAHSPCSPPARARQRPESSPRRQPPFLAPAHCQG
jgi:hypothetical protein